MAIGERSIAEVEAAVADLVPHENEAWLAVRAPAFLSVPEVLQALGVVGDASSIPLFLEDERGARFRLDTPAAPVPGPTLTDLTAAAGFPCPSTVNG